MSFSNYAENVILDELFGGVAYTPPATLYIGLSSTPITDTAAPTEPIGGGYARADIANNTTNFPATGGDGIKTNGQPITFDPATGDWGDPLTHFFIADAATGTTNILAWGDLGTPKTITNGDTASFAANALTITLD